MNKNRVPENPHPPACECEGCDECLTDEVSCCRGALVTLEPPALKPFVACGSCADEMIRMALPYPVTVKGLAR